MKKLLVYFILLLLAEVFAVGRAGDARIIPDNSVQAVEVTRPASREQVFLAWQTPPQSLLSTYADYFQAYNQTPFAVQQNADGGSYIIYRVKDQAGNSEVCFSYLDHNFNVSSSSGLSYAGSYCDAEVDQVSGDVFGCWHSLSEDGITYDCFVTYDLYHIMGEVGLWKEPLVTVIDSDLMDYLDPTPDDEFIWPEVKIGASPISGCQRVYLVASNQNDSDGTTAFPSENVMICYADFTTEDLTEQSNLQWNYTTIPVMDDWNSETPQWRRSFKSWTVLDNQVVFMGYVVSLNGSSETEQMFCLLNANYGEGEWEEYYADWVFPEENPSFINPLTQEVNYLYSNLQYSPQIPYPSVQQRIMHSSNFNLIAVQDGTRVTWAGAMGITFFDGTETRYRPGWRQIYPKTFSFDLLTHTFSFQDVYPRGSSPADEQPMRPWDLDEDGIIDEFDTEGFPKWAQDWPIYHWDAGNCCHYNQYFLTSNEENGWLALVWMDGTRAYAAQENLSGFEAFCGKPEITICLSNDWGENWSDPIFLNACSQDEYYAPELDGMIPCYLYPADQIIDEGNGSGILQLFFLDDNDFGSYHCLGHGSNNGGTLQYAALRLNFDNIITAEETSEITKNEIKSSNYPNPFNPETRIIFQNKCSGTVEITVYDLKGRCKRRLMNSYLPAGEQQVLWNGKNDAGDYVASGMYFYKITTATSTVSGKMLLLK